MSYYQMIAVTVEMGGDNAYLHNKSELDFGVHTLYHTNKDNIGVERIVEQAREEILA